MAKSNRRVRHICCEPSCNETNFCYGRCVAHFRALDPCMYESLRGMTREERKAEFERVTGVVEFVAWEYEGDEQALIDMTEAQEREKAIESRLLNPKYRHSKHTLSRRTSNETHDNIFGAGSDRRAGTGSTGERSHRSGIDPPIDQRFPRETEEGTKMSSEFLKSSPQIDRVVLEATTGKNASFENLRESLKAALEKGGVISRDEASLGYGSRLIPEQRTEPIAALPATPAPEPTCMRVIYPGGQARHELYDVSEAGLDRQEAAIRQMYSGR